MRKDVHSSGIKPKKKGLAVFTGLIDERKSVTQYLVIYRLHSLRTEFAIIHDLLLPDLAPTCLFSGIVNIGCPSVDQVSGSYRVLQRLRVIGVAWVFHRVK